MAYLLAGKNCQGVWMKERESDRKKRQEEEERHSLYKLRSFGIELRGLWLVLHYFPSSIRLSSSYGEVSFRTDTSNDAAILAFFCFCLSSFVLREREDLSSIRRKYASDPRCSARRLREITAAYKFGIHLQKFGRKSYSTTFVADTWIRWFWFDDAALHPSRYPNTFRNFRPSNCIMTEKLQELQQSEHLWAPNSCHSHPSGATFISDQEFKKAQRACAQLTSWIVQWCCISGSLNSSEGAIRLGSRHVLVCTCYPG